MKTSVIAALALGAVAMCSSAVGAMKPGQWDYTMKTEMPGMPFTPPPVNYSKCVTQDDVENGKAYQQQQDKRHSDCKVENMKQNKGTVSYDISCAGKHPATGHYDFTYGNDSMTGKGTMNAEGHTVNTSFEAKRSGDCKK
jgi:hypothetical protein